jgi:transposase
MSTPVPLRFDFDTIGLRMLARRSRDPDQTRRLLALAEIYDGGSRPDITLLPLPPKSPELNPVENIWQFMRDNWLSNRGFKSYDDILDHCCFAWNKLIDMPWKIMSIGTRDWVYRS